MKYVMLVTREGQHLPIIFPDALTHATVAMLFSAGIEVELKTPQPSVKSAGFIGIGLDVEVHGRSESLGVDSASSDGPRIMMGDSVAFMPDEMLKPLIDKLEEAKT